MKIGVFDSGVGGLTVLKAIEKILPGYDLIYFGDSAHLPYGNKSKKNILQYSIDNSNFLLEQGAEILVIACNTASAVARRTLEKQFSIPLTGVIIPGVESALSVSGNSPDGHPRICIAGTYRTIESGIYKEEILSRNPKAEVIEVACPSLVSIIEEGMEDKAVISSLLDHYLSDASQKSDTLVLGCTHYPLFKSKFMENFPQLKLVDSAEATAKKVWSMVEQINNQPQNKKGKVEIYSNDINEVFTNISHQLFPEAIVTEIK